MSTIRIKNRIILFFTLLVAVIFLAVDTPSVYAQYPTLAPNYCALNSACGIATCLDMSGNNHPCNSNQACVTSYYCNPGVSCSITSDVQLYCTKTGASCVTLDPSLCGACHPTQCSNVGARWDCCGNNAECMAKTDDCNVGNYICGYCPGTGPDPGPTETTIPTLPPTCAVTSTANCSSPDGKQITTTWNVTDVNFIIAQIQGRFNQGPNYGDWPTGPGDQSIPWGKEISGTEVTNVVDNTNYSTSVGVYKDPIDGTANNYLCKSTSIVPILCPTPIPIPGTIKVRAVDLSSIANPTCGDANSASAATFGAPVTYTVSGLSPKTVSGGSFATWSNVAPDVLYTVDNSTISGYTPLFPCWTTDVPVGGNGVGPARTLLDGQTLTWNIGYTPIDPWLQAGGGGDVYAWGAIQSSIPPHAPAYPLCDNGPGGTPGIVTYGGSSTNVGEGIVSSAPYGWLVNEAYAQTDFYQLFYHRFGSPTTSDFPSGTTISSLAQIPVHPSPYYINGDLTIDIPNLVVPTGYNIVIFVNGDLTIKKSINISGSGFIAFIVNGNITVDSSVGVSAASSVPVLEGIYITSSVTSPRHTFSTGASTAAATARLVGKGIFIAGAFNLARNLQAYGGNTNISAELFIYNPQLLLTMPDKMKEVPVTWQEVAP